MSLKIRDCDKCRKTFSYVHRDQMNCGPCSKKILNTKIKRFKNKSLTALNAAMVLSEAGVSTEVVAVLLRLSANKVVFDKLVGSAFENSLNNIPKLSKELKKLADNLLLNKYLW